MSLIDADIFMNELNESQQEFDEYYKGLGKAKTMLLSQPVVDAEIVKYGHWNEKADCSVCGMPAPTDDRIDFINISELNFCPYCGAKMY